MPEKFARLDTMMVRVPFGAPVRSTATEATSDQVAAPAGEEPAARGAQTDAAQPEEAVCKQEVDPAALAFLPCLQLHTRGAGLPPARDSQDFDALSDVQDDPACDLALDDLDDSLLPGQATPTILLEQD